MEAAMSESVMGVKVPLEDLDWLADLDVPPDLVPVGSRD